MLSGNYVVLGYETINKVTILKYIIKPIMLMHYNMPLILETVLLTHIEFKK